VAPGAEISVIDRSDALTLLLHLGLLELAEQLGALGDLLLQHHRFCLDGLSLACRRPARPGRAGP